MPGPSVFPSGEPGVSGDFWVGFRGFIDSVFLFSFHCGFNPKWSWQRVIQAVYLLLITAQGEAGRAPLPLQCELVINAWVGLEPPKHLLYLQRNPDPVISNAHHVTSSFCNTLSTSEPTRVSPDLMDGAVSST